ncbi:MAG: hypothetical protein RLZZ570_1115 [Bacteroidota bacterium]
MTSLMHRFALIAAAVALSGTSAWAQFKGDSTWLRTPVKQPRNSIHQRWLSGGLTFTQGFTTILDDARSDYFVKPSLAGGLVLSINPVSWISLTSGLVHEQHGAGILMPDLVGGIGNADSTHRTRLRLNTWGVPLGASIRTPVLFDNTRLSASYGFTYHHLARATKVYHSIEDGFHQVEEYTSFFQPNFWTNYWTVGVEIEVPRSAVLQLHYVASRSNANVYRGGPFEGTQGILFCQGLKLSTLF